MKELPKVNESFGELYEMLIAPIRSKLLLTGIELKVFDQLDEPRSAEAVAETIGTHPENTRLFMDGLAASDLIVKKDGLYQNTPAAQTFLVEDSPTFLGQIFNFWARSFDVSDLPKLVKEGPPTPSPEADGVFEEMLAQLVPAMANYERAGTAQRVADIISQLPEFPTLKKMLDLGGGAGLIGIAIVASHPSLKGVIFDLPTVAKAAESFIKEYEMEDRMEVLGGDYLQDSIGVGYDLIWASGSLYFGKGDIDSLMKKIYAALDPDGVFISFHEGLTHERTKPDIMALGWTPMVLMGQDMGFDQGKIADSMLRAGFRSVRSRTVDTPMGPMDLDIGRKAEG